MDGASQSRSILFQFSEKRKSLFRENQEELRCCTTREYLEWAAGGEATSEYEGENPKWAFCCEADRVECLRLRSLGQCIRREEEWWKLLRDDAKRAKE